MMANINLTTLRSARVLSIRTSLSTDLDFLFEIESQSTITLESPVRYENLKIKKNNNQTQSDFKHQTELNFAQASSE